MCRVWYYANIMTKLYTKQFYSSMVDTSTASAEVILPLLLSLIKKPTSIIDVGCGEAKWLAVFEKLGIEDVRGVDGPWVDVGRLAISENKFTSIDLEKPFSLEKGADMIMTLEVAEHISPDSAADFVASLVSHAPLVLFSAAIPYQGGSHHVNEQWPEYWADKFAAHGYVPIDLLRHRIWDDVRVSVFYRQNIMLYVKETELSNHPALVKARDDGYGMPLALVHPDSYLAYARKVGQISALLERPKAVLRPIKHAVLRVFR